jgi:hypothetical protein
VRFYVMVFAAQFAYERYRDEISRFLGPLRALRVRLHAFLAVMRDVLMRCHSFWLPIFLFDCLMYGRTV